ncbi:MAG: hypothetical protein K8H86_07455, partial [Ignavibacteriaceae bacterium]|nr:hypothetical protein [Ignavibacteriaceae bacterium]
MTYYEFHVSRNTRKKYKFDKNLFALNGDFIIADFKQARILTEKINETRRIEGQHNLQVTAGQLNALGLLHEIYHYIIKHYEEKENNGVIARSINYLQQHLGEKELHDVLIEYINEFPPQKVFKGIQSPEEFLEDTTYAKPNREVILEELILLHLENNNPAAKNFDEFYDDEQLSKKVKYIEVIDSVEQFFITEKPVGKELLPLFQFLRKPIYSAPQSLEAQLDFILENWDVYIQDKFHKRILSSKDLIYEDAKLFIQQGGGEKATPPVPNYVLDKDFFQRIRSKIAAGMQLTKEETNFYYAEPERFTQDTDWMPRVVMIAKNAFVWLNQLSKTYQRSITRLDQIPDEELDKLALWNLNSLWLIGLWERSTASQKVKQYTGNPEAAASAYSLYDYVIAEELGGEKAFENLKHRAWMRGIRMASDMVPNHTGIFSKWITESPHYFVQRNDPPYPGYSFHGPNLSDDDRFEIRIEDKYYSKKDAAVVFQRKDNITGKITYIYHGNDGTNMPWNDTAQLNLLNAEVRESLIQTIMHVARKTPIIRFDAAMTLTKKHFQRLWFPQPGTGGAIPSRSDYTMTREEFDTAIPEEFWREVVDRMNAEMPQTLLLAEAFWLMEGFFVRTLGMHRVYNSAFMHMMMKEENSDYRELIKNTLDFNPEILKRYVNFMSNPDEETAVNQFGKGDKYFGVAVMMITLPGLPMFGHGQVEGFAEKYGMEYKRAYYDEYVDTNLVKRHEAEIFPLIQKRWLFSPVTNFELYDFIDDFGNINENVFAFSNQAGSEKTIVIYNNSYSEARGTIRKSVPKLRDSQNVSGRTLSETMGFNNDGNHYYILFNHKTKQEFLFNGSDLYDNGIYIWLQGYDYRLYLNFREILDTSGEYYRLNIFLNNRGVSSIEYALKELNLSGVHKEIEQLINAHNLELIEEFCFTCDPILENKGSSKDYKFDSLPIDIYNNLDALVREINYAFNPPVDANKLLEKITQDYNFVKIFHSSIKNLSAKKSFTTLINTISSVMTVGIEKDYKNGLLVLLVFVKNLLEMYKTSGNDIQEIYDKLLLQRALNNALTNYGYENITDDLRLLEIISSPEYVNNIKNMLDISVPKSSNFKPIAYSFIDQLFDN